MEQEKSISERGGLIFLYIIFSAKIDKICDSTFSYNNQSHVYMCEYVWMKLYVS